MKSIDLSNTPVSLDEALALAEQGSLVLRTTEGREFVLAELDEFDREVSLVQGNDELLKFLDERAQETERLSLEEVRRRVS
jgi:hypothetical protein